MNRLRVAALLREIADELEREDEPRRDPYARVEAYLGLRERGLWRGGRPDWTHSRVYFIDAPDVDRIKIGVTRHDVGTRFHALQTGSPVKLILLGTMVGGVEDEGDLHARWARHHVRGEWFAGVIRPEVQILIQEWKPLLGRLLSSCSR